MYARAFCYFQLARRLGGVLPVWATRRGVWIWLFQFTKAAKLLLRKKRHNATGPKPTQLRAKLKTR